MPKSVFIIGHKNPDTDSICAAIAYSYLKNTLSTGENYVPKKAGSLNEETRYVLNRFNVPEPETVTDVGAQLSDIEYRQLEGVSGNISLKKAWETMLDKNVATLPVVGQIFESALKITVSDSLHLGCNSFKLRRLMLCKVKVKTDG